jgi:hypothetical protein
LLNWLRSHWVCVAGLRLQPELFFFGFAFTLFHPVNKTLLIQAIADTLQDQVAGLQESSRKTRSAGNDAESKSEGKYDTRSTEENYLADGFARQAQAAANTMAVFKSMAVASFNSTTPIDVSALVQLKFQTDTVWFFLAPVAGGTEVLVDGVNVTVLSIDSPLGAQLIGLQVGQQTQSPVAEIISIE